MSSSAVLRSRWKADSQDGKERTFNFCFRGEFGTGMIWTLLLGQLGRPQAKEQQHPQHMPAGRDRWSRHRESGSPIDLHSPCEQPGTREQVGQRTMSSKESQCGPGWGAEARAHVLQMSPALGADGKKVKKPRLTGAGRGGP